MYEEKLKELRRKSYFEARKNDPKRPVSYWSEEDRALGKKVKAFVLILRTRGCSWAISSGGCTMCGYSNDVCPRGPKREEIIEQVKEASRSYSEEEYVKIFTSGSFLDENEIPKDLWSEILGRFEGAELISIESRPEYVTEDKIIELKGICGRIGAELEISLGLESSNERILIKYVHKGFRVEDYVRAAKKIREEGVNVKTYVLLKPPFVTEAIALRDCINSSCFAANFSEKVSINPVVVQRNTIVEDLWKRGYYRPPWCFSLLEAMSRIKEERPDLELVSSPMKKGSKRGMRGCDKCLEKCLKAIKDFSLSQDPQKLKVNVNCECLSLWREELNLGEKVPFLF